MNQDESLSGPTRKQSTLNQWARQQDEVRRQLESWVPSFGSQAALLASLLAHSSEDAYAGSRRRLAALLPDMLADTARLSSAIQQLHHTLQALQLEVQ